MIRALATDGAVLPLIFVLVLLIKVLVCELDWPRIVFSTWALAVPVSTEKTQILGLNLLVRLCTKGLAFMMNPLVRNTYYLHALFVCVVPRDACSYQHSPAF